MKGAGGRGLADELTGLGRRQGAFGGEDLQQREAHGMSEGSHDLGVGEFARFGQIVGSGSGEVDGTFLESTLSREFCRDKF
jgi:hypothetical protein